MVVKMGSSTAHSPWSQGADQCNMQFEGLNGKFAYGNWNEVLGVNSLFKGSEAGSTASTPQGSLKRRSFLSI